MQDNLYICENLKLCVFAAFPKGFKRNRRLPGRQNLMTYLISLCPNVFKNHFVFNN